MNNQYRLAWIQWCKNYRNCVLLYYYNLIRIYAIHFSWKLIIYLTSKRRKSQKYHMLKTFFIKNITKEDQTVMSLIGVHACQYSIVQWRIAVDFYYICIYSGGPFPRPVFWENVYQKRILPSVSSLIYLFFTNLAFRYIFICNSIQNIFRWNWL